MQKTPSKEDLTKKTVTPQTKTLPVGNTPNTKSQVMPPKSTTPTTVTPTKEKTLTSGMSMKNITDSGSGLLSRLKQYATDTVTELLPPGEKKTPGHGRSVSSVGLEDSMKTIPTNQTKQGVPNTQQQPPKKKLPKMPWLEDENPLHPIKMNLERISLHGVPYLASCVAYDISQGIIAVGTEMGIIHVIGECEHTFYYDKDFVIRHLAFATNQAFLVAVCEGNATHICIYDLVQKYLRYSVQIGSPVTSLSIPTGSKFAFIGTKTGSLKAVNIVEGYLSTFGLDFRNPIVSIDPHPSIDSQLVVGLEKGNSLVCDLLSRKESIYGSLDKVCSVSWHPTKDFFATGYQSGVLLIWKNKGEFPHIIGNSIFKGGHVKDLEWNGDDLYVNLTQSGNDKSGIWVCKVNFEAKSISAAPIFFGDKISKFILFQTTPHKYFQKGARYAGIIKEKQFYMFDITLTKVTNDSLIRISSFNFEPEYQQIEEVICIEKVHHMNPPVQKKTSTWPLFGGKSAYKKDHMLDFLLIRYKDGGVQTLNSSSELSLVRTSINLNRNKEATCMSVWSKDAVVIGHSDNSINIIHAKSLSQFEIVPSEAYMSEISQVFCFPEFNRICIGHTDGVLDIIDVSTGEYKLLHQLKYDKMITRLEGCLIAGDKGGQKYVLYVGFSNGKIISVSLESGKEIIKKGKKDSAKITFMFAHDEYGSKSITQQTDILPSFMTHQLFTKPRLKFNEKIPHGINKPNIYQLHSKTKFPNPILFQLEFNQGMCKYGSILVQFKNKDDNSLLTIDIQCTLISIQQRTKSGNIETMKMSMQNPGSATSIMILNDVQKRRYNVLVGSQNLLSDEYKEDIDPEMILDSIFVSCDDYPTTLFESPTHFLKSHLLSLNIYNKFQTINLYEVKDYIPDMTTRWSENDYCKVGKYLIVCTDNTIKCFQLPRLKTFKKRKSKLKFASHEIKENGLMICIDEKGYLCAFSLPDLNYVFKHPLIFPKLFRNLIPKSVTVLRDGRIIAAAQENILLGAIVEDGFQSLDSELYQFGIKFPNKPIGFFGNLFTSDFVYSKDLTAFLSVEDTSGEYCKITHFKYVKKEKKQSRSLDLMRPHPKTTPPPPKPTISDVNESPTTKKLEFNSPVIERTPTPTSTNDPFKEPKIPEKKTSMDKNSSVQVAEKKVEETKNVMNENLGKLKERQEHLEHAKDSSEDMKNKGSQLMTNLEKLRKANEEKTFW